MRKCLFVLLLLLGACQEEAVTGTKVQFNYPESYIIDIAYFEVCVDTPSPKCVEKSPAELRVQPGTYQLDLPKLEEIYTKVSVRACYSNRECSDAGVVPVPPIERPKP